MKIKNKKSSLVFLLGFLSFIILSFMVSACSTQKAQIIAPATCEEALGERYHDYTDYEIARLLDEALVEGCHDCLDGCWIPLMQRALDDSRDIPHQHLLQAVKTFNQHRYSNYFHMAVYRYFRDLSRGEGSYRAVDRELLRSYCALLVNNSYSRHDQELDRAMELCQHLDPALYSKIFK